MKGSVALIPLFLVGFTAVHAAKMIRLYLVLMERRIPFWRFVLLYLKTTFVNLVIPFKLGEVFRIYCISRESGKFQTGVLSVVVDRFFDTAVLLLFLLPVQVFLTRRISGVALVLLAVLLLLMILYVTFQSVYTYLNRYIILNKNSNRSLAFLKGLEFARGWYEDVRELITGRSPLIFSFSCLGWMLELGVLKLLSKIIGEYFGIMSFNDYIETIFRAGNSHLLQVYTWVGAVLLGIAALFGTILYLCLQPKACRMKNGHGYLRRSRNGDENEAGYRSLRRQKETE